MYFILLASLTYKIKILANLSMPGEPLLKEEQHEMIEKQQFNGKHEMTEKQELNGKQEMIGEQLEIDELKKDDGNI